VPTPATPSQNDPFTASARTQTLPLPHSANTTERPLVHNPFLHR
jgi:hypothetical protein